MSTGIDAFDSSMGGGENEKKKGSFAYKCSRLLSQAQANGVFLLRDNTDCTRRILSFVSDRIVCHTYVDQTEFMCKLGKGGNLASMR